MPDPNTNKMLMNFWRQDIDFRILDQSRSPFRDVSQRQNEAV